MHIKIAVLHNGVGVRVCLFRFQTLCTVWLAPLFVKVTTIVADGGAEQLRVTAHLISVSLSGVSASSGGAYRGQRAEEETAGALQ